MVSCCLWYNTKKRKKLIILYLNNKTSRTYLYIADGYHDREKGYIKTVTVQSLGYLDVLEKEYDDSISHFSEVVKQMNEEKKNKIYLFLFRFL